jgi:hypothetical protein
MAALDMKMIYTLAMDVSEIDLIVQALQGNIPNTVIGDQAKKLATYIVQRRTDCHERCLEALKERMK